MGDLGSRSYDSFVIKIFFSELDTDEIALPSDFEFI